MKFKILAALSATPFLFVSCANQGDGGDYDVSNPYAAPDYVDDSGSPYETSTADSVNPAYDAPAVYEDTAPSVSPASAPAAQAKVHTVVRGDTLWGLSKKYNVSVASIKQANGLTKDTAVLGARLQIPAQ